RAFRALAPCLWLRQVVPHGPRYHDAGGLRHLQGADHRAAGRVAGAHQGPPAGMGGFLMSHRLGTGGRLIDRARPMDFTFNGKTMRGYAGDTLAAALLGAGQTLVGRSFKYHRPRGIMASGAEEPNAL